MITLLLIIIYITFIGLGIPDSAIGSAWPALYPDLGIAVGSSGFVTAIISIFTSLASFLSARLINRFGTGTVAAVSTFLTAAALIGFAFADSLIWLCVCAVPTGFGAGAIDAALNNYVAVRFKSHHMSFLHCAYGVGVALSPFIFSFALENGDWRLGYRIIFYIQLFICLVTLIALPLWKRAATLQPDKESFTPVTLSYPKMIKYPAIRAGWLAFFSTCALEFTCDHWCTTYLVSSGGATESAAAMFLTVYYIGMTLGRFLSGVLATRLSNKKIICIGYSTVFIGIAALFFPLPVEVKGIAIALIGLGNGPTFPNLVFLTPVHFGREVSQSLISSQMLAANIGILIMPPLFGALAQALSLNVFPYFAAALFISMTVSTAVYFRRAKKMGGCLLSLSAEKQTEKTTEKQE